MRPDKETLLRWEQEYLNAPKAKMSIYVPYGSGQPNSLSLLDHLNYTPPEHNQGQCGDCWVWAGTGVMAIALDVDHNIHDRLSIQYMNSNMKVIGLSCCSGGNLPYLADFYSTTGYQQAVPWSNTNADWKDGDASCDTPGSSIGTIPNYPVTSIQAVTIQTQGIGQATAIENIKNILNQHKAVYFSFVMPTRVDGNSFMDFWDHQPEATRWNPDFSCGHAYDYGNGWGHAVLCVGYNDEDPENSYWIMLNSWGVTPGRPTGLFRLDMNMNYDCMFSFNGFYYSSFNWWTLDIVYNPADGAYFTAAPTSGAAPLAVSFTDTSQGNFTSWTWDFGDGSTSTSRNPVHTYTTPGTYTVSLTVSGPSGTFTRTRTGLISVLQPAISLSVSSLSPVGLQGSNAPGQSFMVWNSGAGTLDFTISTDRPWLSCTPAGNTSTGASDKKTITVDYATSSLAPGSYSGTITITAPGSSNTPQTIPVSLTVYSPSIACSVSSLSNTCILGCNASQQTFQIWNSGSGTLSYTLTPDQAWITCTASGTSTGPTDRKIVTITYSTQGLSVGSHAANITISDPAASNDPLVIPVTLTVSPPPLPAIAHNAPSQIAVSCTQGSNPSSRVFDVWNSGGGTLHYNFSASQAWLACSPVSGTSSFSCIGSGHGSVTASFSVSGLAVGTYSANITISDPGASNTPQVIPVSLTIKNPAPPPAPPLISINPSSLSVTCVKGSNASSRVLDVWNSGGGALSYSIYSNVPWLSCSPSGGTSQGSHGSISLYLSTSYLDAGVYSGTLTVSAPQAINSPQNIPVSLTVSDEVTAVRSALAFEPSSIHASSAQGVDAADMSFSLWSSDGGSVSCTISTDAGWITVDPVQGALTGEHTMITVHLETAGLAVGEYERNIIVASSEKEVSNSPQIIPVHVSVKQAGGTSLSSSGGPGGGGGCFICASSLSGPGFHGLPDHLSAGIVMLFYCLFTVSLSHQRKGQPRP